MFHVFADNESIYDPASESFYLFEPHLKLEFGKAGSFEFTIPSTNLYFNRLRELVTVISVWLDDEELFRGRILSIETDIQNFHKIYCEGDLSYLVDSVQKAVKYEGTTHQLFRKIINGHNSMVESYKQFQVGYIDIPDRPIILTGQSENGISPNVNIDYNQVAVDSIVDEWNNSWDYINTCLIDQCGGYLKTRHNGATTYIDYFLNSDGQTAQEITFGENMLDLTHEVNAEELFTVLIPIGDNNLTIESVNGGSKELVDYASVSQYGRIVRTHVFSNVTQPSTLMEDGLRYLSLNCNLPVTITVNAIDMHLIDGSIDMIKIGSLVRLRAPIHGVVEYLTCTEIEYDFSDPANNSYTFGNPKQTLTQRYREDLRLNGNPYDQNAGAGAGAAADAAAAEAAKKRKELEDIFFDELFVVEEDGEGGRTISIKDMYQEYQKDKTILEKEVGIDFNAREGNVNLGSVIRRLDKNEKEIEDGLALVTTHVDDKVSSVSLQVQRLQKKTDDAEDAIAELRLSDSEKGAILETINVDLVDLHDADLVTKGKIEAVEAQINTLKARKITAQEISAVIANIEVLHVGTERGGGTIIANNIYQGVSATSDTRVVTEAGATTKLNNIGVNNYPGTNHAHEITENTADGTITLGYAVKKPQTFNIRATKTYKEGVAAAELAVNISNVVAVDYDSYSSSKGVTVDDYYTNLSNNGKYIRSKIKVTLSNKDGTALNDVVIMAQVDSTKINISSIDALDNASEVASDSVMFEDAKLRRTDSGYLQGVLQVALNNGNTKKYRIYFDETKAIASKIITSTTGVATPTQPDHSASVTDAQAYRADGKLCGTVKVTFSDGTSKTILVQIDETKSKNAGAADKSISSTTGVATPTQPDHSASVTNAQAYRADGKLCGTVKVTFSDGTSKTILVQIDETKSYNAGAASVSNVSISYVEGTSTPSSPNFSAYVTNNRSYRTNGYLCGTVKAVFSDNTSKTILVQIDETRSYNAGYAAGYNNVSCSVDDSGEKSGPYGSRQLDIYFRLNGSIVATAKIQWYYVTINGVTYESGLSWYYV